MSNAAEKSGERASVTGEVGAVFCYECNGRGFKLGIPDQRGRRIRHDCPRCSGYGARIRDRKGGRTRKVGARR